MYIDVWLNTAHTPNDISTSTDEIRTPNKLMADRTATDK